MTAFGLVMKWLSEIDGMDGMYEDLMHYYYIEQNQDGFWVDDLLFVDFEDAMNYTARKYYQEPVFPVQEYSSMVR